MELIEFNEQNITVKLSRREASCVAQLITMVDNFWDTLETVTVDVEEAEVKKLNDDIRDLVYPKNT
jgi:hypothetical protein